MDCGVDMREANRARDEVAVWGSRVLFLISGQAGAWERRGE